MRPTRDQGQAGPLPQRSTKPAPPTVDDALAGSQFGSGPVNPDAMSSELIQFLTAIDEYKRNQQRPFPSWSEILEILKSLGYQKNA